MKGLIAENICNGENSTMPLNAVETPRTAINALTLTLPPLKRFKRHADALMRFLGHIHLGGS